MSKYLALYETMCPEDEIRKDDPRRGAIIAEMRGVCRARTVPEAAKFIEWWIWDDKVRDSRAWAHKARRIFVRMTASRKDPASGGGVS